MAVVMGASAVALFVAAFLVTVAVQAAPKDGTCSENDKACSINGDCCRGCCKDGKCSAYAGACAGGAGASPCATFECPPGKVCYLQDVQCLQSPCKPILACKSADNDYDYS